MGVHFEEDLEDLTNLALLVHSCFLARPGEFCFPYALKHMEKVLCAWIRLPTGIGMTNRNCSLLYNSAALGCDHDFLAIAENHCNFPQ